MQRIIKTNKIRLVPHRDDLLLALYGSAMVRKNKQRPLSPDRDALLLALHGSAMVRKNKQRPLSPVRDDLLLATYGNAWIVECRRCDRKNGEVRGESVRAEAEMRRRLCLVAVATRRLSG